MVERIHSDYCRTLRNTLDGSEFAGFSCDCITEAERDTLRIAVKILRQQALRVGSMSPYWEQIDDAEALIAGKQTRLTKREIIDGCKKDSEAIMRGTGGDPSKRVESDG